MKHLRVCEDIVPVGEFKRQASGYLHRVNDEKRPLVITQNGSPIGVLIPPEDFDELQLRRRFLAAVQEGLAQAEAGQLLDGTALDAELEEVLPPKKKGKAR
jgi:prevent-host-death family protein